MRGIDVRTGAAPEVTTRDLVARLYDRQASRAYRIALLISTDAELAGDVLCDAFLELAGWPGLGELAPSLEAETVLNAIHGALERSLTTGAVRESGPAGALLGESLSRRERQVLAYCWHGGAPLAHVANLVSEDDSSVRAMLARTLRGIALDLEADADADALGLLHRGHG